MISFTITLGDRKTEPLELTVEEAQAMAIAGMRFAECDLEYNRIRISQPYRTLHNLERGTLTIEQK